CEGRQPTHPISFSIRCPTMKLGSTALPASGIFDSTPAKQQIADGDDTGGHMRQSFWALTLGSIGVVYGDIGTSPLYAVRESVLAAVGPGNPAGEPVVLGILSLIIWALLLVVTAKYILILLRADNNGEGGTLALMALARRAVGPGGIVVLL